MLVEVIHKKHWHKQRAASLLACESLTQSKRAYELISGSLKLFTVTGLPFGNREHNKCQPDEPEGAKPGEAEGLVEKENA